MMSMSKFSDFMKYYTKNTIFLTFSLESGVFVVKVIPIIVVLIKVIYYLKNT